ncbi:recombination directionality factor [Streptomyces inhibens]|uniref:recombination directionality factor n=1 Tax=Streptomyces inhibens TaxID=2293571 RepID=UPI00402ADE28
MTVALEHPCKPEVLALGGTSIRREVVGQFQFGCVIDNRLVALPDWRVTTDNSGVAAEVARILGGRTESALINGSDPPSVQVIIDGPGGIATHMKLWGSRGLMHHCDGVVFLSPDGDRGRPCGCPRLMADRKEQANLGRRPQPNRVAIFQLAGNYDMGAFRFQSTSWKHAEDSA